MNVRELGAAWDWVLRLRDDAVSQEDLTEWLRWYEADERNKAAFEEMQTFWRGADQVLDGPRAPSMAQLLGASSSRRKPGSSQKRFFNWPPAFVGTAVGVIAAVGVAVWWTYPALMRKSPTIAPTVVQQTLPDGSRVELAAKSSVKVQYTAQERTLELNGGEAYFSVARNRERPFIVKVGGLRVRAVGTAFNIRKAGERVVVAVTEGTVEISPSGGHSSAGVRVTAGNRAIWPTGSAAPAIAPADVAHTLAWRQGRLEYLNEPLAAVIADVNRYARRPVAIRGEAIGRIVFSGTVFTDATDVWLQALPRVFPVEILTDSSGHIVLAGSAAE